MASKISNKLQYDAATTVHWRKHTWHIVFSGFFIAYLEHCDVYQCKLKIVKTQKVWIAKGSEMLRTTIKISKWMHVLQQSHSYCPSHCWDALKYKPGSISLMKPGWLTKPKCRICWWKEDKRQLQKKINILSSSASALIPPPWEWGDFVGRWALGSVSGGYSTTWQLQGVKGDIKDNEV